MLVAMRILLQMLHIRQKYLHFRCESCASEIVSHVFFLFRSRDWNPTCQCFEILLFSEKADLIIQIVLIQITSFEIPGPGD